MLYFIFLCKILVKYQTLKVLMNEFVLCGSYFCHVKANLNLSTNASVESMKHADQVL